jgi:hypothetical protein
MIPMTTTKLQDSPYQTWYYFLGGTILVENAITKKLADLLFDSLENEIKYIPRGQLTFDLFGKQIPLPRIKAFYGSVKKNGDYPIYRYGGKNYPQVENWTPTLKLIDDHIGYHSDKTKDMKRGSSVFVLSLGETRILDIQDKKTKKKIYSIELTHGSLFRLGWEMNELCKHRIRKETKSKGIRLGLTFRSIHTYVEKESGKYYTSDNETE